MLQTQDFYSEIKELTQILLKISEEKIGGWGLWSGYLNISIWELGMRHVYENVGGLVASQVYFNRQYSKLISRGRKGVT